MNWDWIISVTIIVALILGFWAKISHQTIPELFASIREMVSDKTEDSVESIGGIVPYN